MFWKSHAEGWPLEGADTLAMKCTHCGNTGQHFVYVEPQGLSFGLIFCKKPLVGSRKYFWLCPTCGYPAREITKAQALSMRKVR